MVEAVAPVSGRLVQVWPHAYAILTPDKVGVLVHLGLDTVSLGGAGFTVHASEGESVEAGDPVAVSGLRTDNIGMSFHGFYRPTGG